MSITKEYLNLSNEYQTKFGEKTILFMMVGKFYEVYAILEDDLSKLNANVDIQNAVQISTFINTCDFALGKKSDCSMAGFPELYLDKYVKKMQEIGYTVVVYNQEGSGKNITRVLSGIFSPGTYFTEDVTSLNNNTTCIWIDLVQNKGINKLSKGKYIVVGIANLNVFTGQTSFSQFQELFVDNPTTYDNLERFISIYNPSETIIISNLETKYVHNMIQYTNIQSKKTHIIDLNCSNNNFNVLKAKECEKPYIQETILRKMFVFDYFNNFTQIFYGNHVALNSFCFLLEFILQHNPQLVKNIKAPEFEHYSNKLILANHSLKQLHILPEDDSKSKYSCVLNMLNNCLTPMGTRKFNDILLSPITDCALLQKEYDMTDYLLSNLSYFKSIFHKPLSSIKDLHKFTRQLYLFKISPKVCFHIVSNLETIKNIFIHLNQNSTFETYLKFHNVDFDNISSFCDQIIDFITNTLDLNLCHNIDNCHSFETNFIKCGINQDLDLKTNLLNESTSLLDKLKDYFNNLIAKSEKKSNSTEFVKYHITEKFNYSLVCTSRRAKLLNDMLPSQESIVHFNEPDYCFTVSKKQFQYNKQSATNVHISDFQIDKICSNIFNVNSSMKDIVALVYHQFIENFQQFKYHLDQIADFVTLLDVTYNKATIASKYNYCKPVIDIDANKSFVNASNLRHCIIEQIQQDEELYVANNIHLGSDSNADGMLLYGTNAVGKTSLIRSLGIAVVMAQAGIFVPCSSFVFKPYEYIFTRILGNDNIFKGLSTFAVEMSELRTILRLCNENSLILGDELCSGTEIVSAISIFVAGIQHLSSVKSSFIFATHLHEIVDYDEIKTLLENNLVLKHLEVVYNKEQDLLIYDRKLKDGPGNSLYGLEVCKSLSLADDFIESAYKIRNKYHNVEHGEYKKSHFNAKKIVSMCEQCGNKTATEVHHLQHQQEANEKGIIKKNNMIFHKNKKANLASLCTECHDNFHKTGKQHKKVKTSKGSQLVEI